MNKQAETAYNQYRDLVCAWQITNPYMAECAAQLIQWIENKRTGSDIIIRQDVKSVNWESLLSGFPTESLQEEMKRREVKPAVEYKEDLKIIDQVHTCGTHIITARNEAHIG